MWAAHTKPFRKPARAAAWQPALRWITSVVSTNVFKRVILGVLMLNAFILLCKSNKLYMMVFTVCLTLGISYELTSLCKTTNRPLFIHPIQVGAMIVIIYLLQFIPLFKNIFPEMYSYPVMSYYRSILFFSYAFVFVTTVAILQKHLISSQLLLLAVSHISATIMGIVCGYACLNIARGSFYYFYPCILVISNDISAYFVGKLCGRRPLYPLSPKKTIEGFLGASVCTLLVGQLLCYLKLHCHFLPDALDEAMRKPFRLYSVWLSVPSIYIHNLAFSAFASFVAPFVGFFASAIKRTFRKKDFGTLIPGHGGLTDRMDCQLFMVFFTYFYCGIFIKSHSEAVLSLIKHIRNNYTREEIDSIVAMLQKSG